jgi:hypothetical protein
LDVVLSSRAPANEYDTQLDANISTRAPSGEYDTELDATISSRAPSGEYDTELDATISSRAPASEYDTELSDIQADLDNPSQYKADVSALDTPDNFKADVSGLALEATLTDIKGGGWTDENLTTIDANVDSILEDTGTTLPTAISNLNNITADNVLDATVEGTYSLKEVLRIMSGVLAGKLSGGGTTTLTFRDISDSLDRVVATVDSSGNRSAIAIDET